jgi:hypothetical protein
MARLVAKGRTAYSLSQPEDGSSTAEAPYFHPDAWLEKTPFEHADFSADVSVDEPGRCNYRCAIDPEWQRAGLLAGEAGTPARTAPRPGSQVALGVYTVILTPPCIFHS